MASYRCGPFSHSNLSLNSFHEGIIEPKSYPIPTNELANYVTTMKTSGGFEEQFFSVPRGQIMRWDYAKQVIIIFFK